MKVIFMGTPEFAIPALSELINSQTNQVVAVFTAAPKPQNRGLKQVYSPVHILAENHHIPVYTPNSLKKTEVIELITCIEADIIVVAAYGFLIPKEILYAKKYGSINIHPSALPKYRGAAPLQRTIVNGEQETAICIMQMDEGLDTGDIILQEKLALSPKITFSELHDQCAAIGARLLIKTLAEYTTLPKIPQDNNQIIYAHKLKKEESRINWEESADKLDCKIRGMNPWPGVYFEYKEKIIKILEADFDNQEHNFMPGTVVNNDLKIACGQGFLIIKKLQQAGKKVLMIKDFLRGEPILAGTKLVKDEHSN
ncbi:methionyl-tRNA formyltransferase [Candidatus Trichorickettsia mobilis]|nr:methionyl-tRNA formyltransferase [Candidatus Trichorickettsia mobilis]